MTTTTPTKAEVRAMYEQALRSSDGGNPRVHPNGFIQLDLETPVEAATGHSGASRRLHVWNPPGLDLPSQARRSPIHDHVFDMESTVIVGQLRQIVYDASLAPVVFRESGPCWTHEVCLANYSQASKSTLEPTGVFITAISDPSYAVYERETYTQAACTFHDTLVHGPCLTIMTKTKVYEGRPARVLIELGQKPDNDFVRSEALTPDTIYAAIERTLEDA
jgi:hypothetical protein